MHETKDTEKTPLTEKQIRETVKALLEMYQYRGRVWNLVADSVLPFDTEETVELPEEIEENQLKLLFWEMYHCYLKHNSMDEMIWKKTVKFLFNKFLEIEIKKRKKIIYPNFKDRQ